MATIATHNGSTVARQHNIRNRRVTDKEDHIDPSGEYEIWHDERLEDAYQRIFSRAQAEYNSRQTREERKISDYLTQVKNDNKQHPVYEMIVGVYPAQDESISKDTQHDILRQYVDEWTKRNPNMEMIGAYYHADEQGQPHVHIDYIPVGHNYERGMKTRNGLNRALAGQGIHKTGKETAQIQWERQENKALEKICMDKGISVDHPMISGAEHLHTETYKAEQQLKELKGEIVTEQTKNRDINKTGKLWNHNKVQVPVDEYQALINRAHIWDDMEHEKEIAEQRTKESLKAQEGANKALDEVQAHEQSLKEREQAIREREWNVEQEVRERVSEYRNDQYEALREHIAEYEGGNEVLEDFDRGREYEVDIER